MEFSIEALKQIYGDLVNTDLYSEYDNDGQMKLDMSELDQEQREILQEVESCSGGKGLMLRVDALINGYAIEMELNGFIMGFRWAVAMGIIGGMTVKMPESGATVHHREVSA